MDDSSDVTRMLRQADAGDPSAAEGLLPLVYDELRRLAAANLADEQPGLTLQPTALVHEAWLRLVDVDLAQRWSSRRHFFGAAAEAMRRILIDRARRRKRQKHGGDRQRVSFPLEEIPNPESDEQLESLDEALRRFEQVDPVACELVKLRYFAGLSAVEAAETLQLAARTADRLWAYAKAWLLREIQKDAVESSRDE